MAFKHKFLLDMDGYCELNEFKKRLSDFSLVSSSIALKCFKQMLGSGYWIQKREYTKKILQKFKEKSISVLVLF